MKNLLQTTFLFAFLVTYFNSNAQFFADAVLKKNVAPISNSLQRIMQLQPQTFEYNTAKFTHLQLQSGVQFGFTDKNMEAVFPQLVREKQVSYMYGKKSYRSAAYNTIEPHHLVPVLVASIQELHTEIEKLKIQISELKKSIP